MTNQKAAGSVADHHKPNPPETAASNHDHDEMEKRTSQDAKESDEEEQVERFEAKGKDTKTQVNTSN